MPVDSQRRADRAVKVSRAIVLYGRVGTYRVRTASMKKGLPGDFDLWRACATTILAHVVRPWREAGRENRPRADVRDLPCGAPTERTVLVDRTRERTGKRPASTSRSVASSVSGE